MPKRFSFFAVLATIAGLLFMLRAPQVDAEGDLANWAEFKRAYVSAEGRVADTGQKGISHSEGQGMAMLIAVKHGDRASFERLWDWTRDNLRIREDGLLAWRWEPGQGVTDRNNASDGDVLVAWALAEAHVAWGEAAHLEAARQLGKAIRGHLLRPSAFGPVLLPGQQGFEETADGHQIINLSYWVFPAFQALAKVDAAPEWSALEASGLALLDAARFGRWQLPADWIQIRGDKLVPAPGFPLRFGYDAVRIPLYLIWSGLATDRRLQPYRAFWGHFDGAGFRPAWTLLSDDSTDSHGASAGMLAIVSRVVGKPVPMPAATADYYSAVLAGLASIVDR